MDMRYTGELDYEKPIEIADGIYWVGFVDRKYGLHCNPYLIIEGEEAVLIDGGSRTDFSTVMMKILQTGLEPSSIQRLIYHHYDPDLCASIPNLEDIIGRKHLKIISHRENNIFIRYYGGTSSRLCIETMHQEFTFSTGRKLTFIRTPYAHSVGSFVTFDQQTGTLFSSDLFGSYDGEWTLFIEIEDECRTCAACHSSRSCPLGKPSCPLVGIFDFHARIMTSKKALRHALGQIKDLPLERVAPQHGSILSHPADIQAVIAHLEHLTPVGIDMYVKEGE